MTEEIELIELNADEKRQVTPAVDRYGCSPKEKVVVSSVSVVVLIVLTWILWYLEHASVVPLRSILPTPEPTIPMSRNRTVRSHDTARWPSDVDMRFSLHQTGNLWTYLATRVLNTSNFCLSYMTSSTDLISTCLVAIPTPAVILHSIFVSLTNDTEARVHDVNQHLSLYEYCRFRSETDGLWENMTYIQTFNVTEGDVCYDMTCDSGQIGKCQQLRLHSETPCGDAKALCDRKSAACRNVGNPLVCNSTVTAPSHIPHVKLPLGWLFSCRNISYTYIPANITGGPCALSRLGLRMLPLAPSRRNVKRELLLLHILDESCDPVVPLLPNAAIISLAASLVGIPGLAAGTYKTMKKLACLVVKGLNQTSQAIAELLLDGETTRKAALQNRAAIDYLLLKHNHGCEHFENMCCFNLSDNSTSIEKHIKNLRELAADVKEGWDPNNIWSWLIDLLKEWGWKLLVPIVGIIAIVVGLCCCIQCIPICTELSTACASRAVKRHRAADAKIMLQQAEHEVRKLNDYGETTDRFDIELPIHIVYTINLSTSFAVAKGSNGNSQKQG